MSGDPRLQAQESADFLRSLRGTPALQLPTFPRYTKFHELPPIGKAPEQFRPGTRFERPLRPEEKRRKRFSAI